MFWLTLISALFFSAIQAVGEALANHFLPKVNKVLNKTHPLTIGVFFVGWLLLVSTFASFDVVPLWKLICGYLFIGFMINDIAWNITTKLCGVDIPLNYYGTTKWYDRFMVKLGTWGWFMKIVFGIVGTAFLLGLK